jgi:hypothetical protein
LKRAANVVTNHPGVIAWDEASHCQVIGSFFESLWIGDKVDPRDGYVYTAYSIDSQGQTFIQNFGTRKSGSRGDWNYFLQSMAGEPMTSQILMGRSLVPKGPAVAYGLPIRAAGEAPVGVFLVATELKELSRILGANTLGKDGTIFIIGPSAQHGQTLIAHSTIEELFATTVNDQGEEEYSLLGFNKDVFVQDFLQGQKDLYSFRRGDQAYAGVTQEIGNGWTIFLELKDEVVFAQSRTFLFWGIGTAGVGILLLTLVLWLSV